MGHRHDSHRHDHRADGALGAFRLQLAPFLPVTQVNATVLACSTNYAEIVYATRMYIVWATLLSSRDVNHPLFCGGCWFKGAASVLSLFELLSSESSDHLTASGGAQPMDKWRIAGTSGSPGSVLAAAAASPCLLFASARDPVCLCICVYMSNGQAFCPPWNYIVACYHYLGLASVVLRDSR